MKWWHYLLIVLFLLVAFGGSRVALSRGYRNNNPGNIRPGKSKWQGQIGIDYQGSKEGYVIFDTMEHGIRAMTVDLKTKISRGLNTIEKIIPVYAPALDGNNVFAYIVSVSKYAGVAPGEVITPDKLGRVVSGMMRHELGADVFALVNSTTINKGVSLA